MTDWLQSCVYNPSGRQVRLFVGVQ